MPLHRMFGDGELIGDDFVGVPVPYHGEDLNFAVGQTIIGSMVRQTDGNLRLSSPRNSRDLHDPGLRFS